MYVLIDENSHTVPQHELVVENSEIGTSYEGKLVKHVVDNPFHHWKTGCTVFHVMKHNEIEWKITHQCANDELKSFGIFSTGTHDLVDTLITKPTVTQGLMHVKVGHSACVITCDTNVTADGSSLVVVNRPLKRSSAYLYGNATLRYTDGYAVVNACDNSRVYAHHQGRASNIAVHACDNAIVEGTGVNLYCHGRSKATLEYVVGQNSTVHMNETSSGTFTDITGVLVRDAAHVELHGSCICTAQQNAVVSCNDTSVAMVRDNVEVVVRDKSTTVAHDHAGVVTVIGDAKHISYDTVNIGNYKTGKQVAKVVDATTDNVIVNNSLPPLQRRPYARKPKTPPAA